MNKFKKLKILSAIFLLAIVLIPFLTPVLGTAQGTPRDCDDNAVVKCGAWTKTELKDKISGSADLQKIFFEEDRGITMAGIDGAVDGVVTIDGKVLVGGNVVAEQVFSSGRQYIPNSTPDHSLWMRPPAVSFLSNQLDAFVGMEDGAFKFAIIKSCGNPIKPMAVPFPKIFKRVSVDGKPGDFHADTPADAPKVFPNTDITYSITIRNFGFGTLKNIHFSDTLPEGIISRDNPAQRTFEKDYPSLGAGNEIRITLAAKVIEKEEKCIENIAKFTAEGGFKGQDSAWVCVVVPKPKQKINLKLIKFDDKNGDGKKEEGDEVLPGFTFRVNDSLTKTTDQKGEAIFPDITCGSTKIEEINIPSGWQPTFQNPFTINLDCDKDSTIALGNKKVAPPPTPPTPPTPPVTPITPSVVPTKGAGIGPEALPKAGPESAIGAIFTTMGLGYVSKSYLKSKKRLLKAFKKVKKARWSSDTS